MVLPYGVIDNHLKVSENFNIITFFTSFSKKKQIKSDNILEENLIPDDNT